MSRGRPRLPIGEASERWNVRQMPDGRWEATVYVRDHDGVTRRVRRYAATETAVRRAMRQHLRERVVSGGGAITGDTTVSAAVSAWLRYAATRGRHRPQTLRVYESAWGAMSLYIGSLTLREVTPRHIADAADRLHEVRPGQVKNATAALKAAMGFAVREGAIIVNPAREIEPPARRTRTAVRALTPDEEALLLRLVRDHRTERDPRGGTVHGPRPSTLLPDVTLLLMGTGLRIGEALALRWADVSLDGEPPTLTVTGTMVEGHGGPMHRQPVGKTDAASRVLALPADVVEMLRRRREEAPEGVKPVFATRAGRHVSPADVRRSWRAALAGTPLEGITPRDVRKTVATRIERAAGIRAAAEQLGHSRPAVTEAHYTERRRAVDNRGVLEG